MSKRVLRRAALSAAALLLIGSAVAYADVINADGDRVLPSAQTMINLGTVGAGATVTYNLYFLLECRNTAHAVPGSTISLTPQNPIFPPGGAISGTETTIGPVPATWPTAGQTCVGDPVLQSTTASVVTIVAPMVADTGYFYRLEYAKAPTTGLSGISTMTFRLDVSGNNAPVVNVPFDQTVEGNVLGGWTATYAATATDVEDGPLAAPCVPAAGSVLPVGSTGTIVVCTATDSVGATGSGSFRVTVTDTTAPALAGVPGGLAVDTPLPSGANVSWPAPSAVDLVDGPVAVTCTSLSGSLFAVGSTPVSCSASDSRDNVATSSFNVDVTLVDTTPPVLGGVPGDIAVDTADPSGADVSWAEPTANDNIDGAIPVTCAPASGSRFPVTTTTVECSATDAHGNTASDSFTVRVTLVDSTAPSISGMPGDIAVETADAAGGVVTWPNPSAVDNVDGPVSVSCAPASGSRFPVTTTTVTCSASDAAGNEATRAFSVTVALASVGGEDGVAATWGPPFDDRSPFVANGRGTLPLKIQVTVDGVAVLPPAQPMLVLERLTSCDGGTVVERLDSIPLEWSGDRWKLQLKTSSLTPGCWRASVSVDGSVGGSVLMLVGHGTESTTTSAGKTGKQKTAP